MDLTLSVDMSTAPSAVPTQSTLPTTRCGAAFLLGSQFLKAGSFIGVFKVQKEEEEQARQQNRAFEASRNGIKE